MRHTTSPGCTPSSTSVVAKPSATRSSHAYVARLAPWTYASRSGCAFAAARSSSAVCTGFRRVPLVPQVAEESQDLEVEPHDRDRDAEGAVPLGGLRGAGHRHLADHVEVEEEVQRGDGADDDADPDSECVRLGPEVGVDTEQAQQRGQGVHHEDPEGG